MKMIFYALLMFIRTFRQLPRQDSHLHPHQFGVLISTGARWTRWIREESESQNLIYPATAPFMSLVVTLYLITLIHDTRHHGL